jgi:hypothetical protein
MSWGGELDGKALLCNMTFTGEQRTTMFYFMDDKVEEVRVDSIKRHNDDYNFDYVYKSIITKSNYFFSSPSKIFWCDIENIMGTGELAAASKCKARSEDNLRTLKAKRKTDDLIKGALSGEIVVTWMNGTWTSVDRDTLSVEIGNLLTDSFYMGFSGVCEVSNAGVKDEYLSEQRKIVDDSRADYKNKLDKAKAQKKKI